MKNILLILLLSGSILSCSGQQSTNTTPASKHLQTGASQLTKYLPLLKGQKAGLVVNHTSRVAGEHLVDTLLTHQVQVKKIFAPEHGFRGKAGAGEHIESGKDPQTGLPIISLYGATKKPTTEHMQGIDVMVFDIQDVGARFYTYISTMHYVMQACAEHEVPLIILDRPNPNGNYVAGPVLDTNYRSFVGMHPIPIVHGLTVGELAHMINGEGWLKTRQKCSLQVIKNKNYAHDSSYSLPVKPSPNLPNDLAIKLYPSLCLFEGTPISVGRGTPFPFQVIGAPHKSYGSFTFTPASTPGASLHPKHENQKCYGIDFRQKQVKRAFTLQYLVDFYQKTPEKQNFFKPFFNKLAGNATLQRKIKKGWSAQKIRKSWTEDLKAYRQMRQQYLLYP